MVGMLVAQPTLIQWGNPSFEDVPGPARPPLGWYFCGPHNETPPDVHPVQIMNVHLPAKHGKTYAGLVTRDNATQEVLGQALSSPIKKGHCYRLRIHAARATSFSSYSRLTEMPADFSQGVRLQLWAGDGHCNMQELLAQTATIQDTSWTAYDISFSPRQQYDHFFFKVTYTAEEPAYNGHVLIDHLSPIIEESCQDAAPPTVMLLPKEAPSIGTSAQLAGLIEEQLPKVKWVKEGFSLEQQLLPPPGTNRRWVYGNIGIYQIAHLLSAYPDALLTVAVGPRKDPLQQHHIRLLAAEFMAAGLSPKQCLIRPVKKRDLKKTDWLQTQGSGDILWGLDY